MNQTNNPYVNNYGYTYSVGRPQARNTQPLTQEQISKLRQDSNAFDMRVTQEDLWRAACTHKEKDGRSALIDNGDGTFTCTICQEKFKMCDSDQDEIDAAVNTLLNMLQTSKTVYLDASEELISQYYQLIPLLKKFPSLWKRAMDNFAKYEGTAFTDVNSMSPGYSGFTAMQNLLTNPFAGFYGQQPMAAPNPVYGQQPGYYAPQPMAAPVYGAPMDPAMNPMAYGVPGAPAPTAPAPGVMPGMAQPTPAPAAAAPVATPQQEVQQQQVFNV